MSDASKRLQYPSLGTSVHPMILSHPISRRNNNETNEIGYNGKEELKIGVHRDGMLRDSLRLAPQSVPVHYGRPYR